jgi:hypothetical protein
MKPIFLKISIILCTLFFWAGVSTASSILVGHSYDLTDPTDHPSDKKDKKDHNDNIDTVKTLIDLYNNNPDNSFDLPENLTLLGKWESEDGKWESWDNTKGSEFYGSFLTGGTRDESGIISGDWFASDGWSVSNPIYYSFKAANDFALYYAIGETSGDWTIDWTAGNSGKSPDLSHISFWTADGTIPVNPPTNPVPEPATLALVGLGLAGIAGYRRKRRSR